MIPHITPTYSLLAVMLIAMSLLPACSDDPADPKAREVKVRLVDRNCYGPILQIPDPHYAAYGRDEYVDRVGERLRARPHAYVDILKLY